MTIKTMLPTLRPASDVQRAHDVLLGLLFHEELWGTVNAAQQEQILTYLNVLCWVLQHSHNTAFATSLAVVEEFLASAGVAMVDSGGLQMPGPAKGGTTQ